MPDVAKSSRGGKKSRAEIKFLEVPEVHRLRRLVRRETARKSAAGRMPNRDLEETVDVDLGTGARISEILAIRRCDLDLKSDPPTLHICGTLVEPRKQPGPDGRRFVEKLHRQDLTKSGEDRTIILPDHVVEVLRRRLARQPVRGKESPVFASRTGNWLNPANLRTRMRAAVASDEDLVGTTFHTLRRTVGTHVTRELGLDFAREQLGHSDPSITYQAYVGLVLVARDCRATLDRFFTEAPVPSIEDAEEA